MTKRLTIAEKRASFRKLHEAGCFIIPNPWNVGSALVLENLGFKALATTSVGFAHGVGRADGDISLDQALAHFREIVASVDVPVNADFEGAFAHDPEGVARNVALCAETGVAGLSVEDATGDASAPLYSFEQTVARVRAARQALDRSAPDVFLTARTEGFIRGRPDLAETLRRVHAFVDLGADCLFTPGIKTREEIEAVVKAAAPKPVNFNCSSALNWTMQDLAAMGVRRISIGGSLARVANSAFVLAARRMAAEGTFDCLSDAAVSNAELNALFKGVEEKRRARK